MMGMVGKAIGLFAVLVTLSMCVSMCGTTAKQTLPAAIVPAPAVVLTPQQHLVEYKKNIKSGDLAEANRHSSALDKKSKEYKESRDFYDRNKTNVRDKAKSDAAKLEVSTIAIRKEFARKYEISMLDQGMDMHVSALGKNRTIFKIKYILTNRPLVHQLINDAGFMGGLSAVGFKQFVMTDGYDRTWTSKVD